MISTCNTSLNEGRWNWRHDSILINISRMLSKIPGVKVYCDVGESEFLNPSVITGDKERPDIVIIKDNECHVLELTVGFETNMLKNSKRKKTRYIGLIEKLEKDFKVTYFDLSMGAIGIIGSESSSIQKLFLHLGLSRPESEYLLRKIINVCVRTSYYIFCQRNKEWEAPSLLTW